MLERIKNLIELHGFNAVVKDGKVFICYEYYIPTTGEQGYTYETARDWDEAFKVLGLDQSHKLYLQL